MANDTAILSLVETTYRSYASVPESNINSLALVESLLTGTQKPTLFDSAAQLKDAQQTSNDALRFLIKHIRKAWSSVSHKGYTWKLADFKKETNWDHFVYDYEHALPLRVQESHTNYDKALQLLRETEQRMTDMTAERAALRQAIDTTMDKCFSRDESSDTEDEEPLMTKRRRLAAIRAGAPAIGGVSKYSMRMQRWADRIDVLDAEMETAEDLKFKQEAKCATLKKRKEFMDECYDHAKEKWTCGHRELAEIQEKLAKLDTPEYRAKVETLSWVDNKLTCIQDIRAKEEELRKMEKEEEEKNN